ncbi:hypothetical protein CH267_26590 [Rhodococcus sp. 06-621-2]|nr:hypothetical protein [Rhodococcus sp. 06-1059B-a]OZC47591.1 hypothetical protein CH267_26590 [Rhodococcus sp. 06-621-2]OZD74289.1 hypothetical protein CH263_01100 [Rhodococcus sp. 06-1059B-a]
MNIGDRVHIAPGASSVVIIRDIQDNGLVMVENETPGTGVYPYLTKNRPLHPCHHAAASTNRRRRTPPNRGAPGRRRRQLPRRTQQHLTRHAGHGTAPAAVFTTPATTHPGAPTASQQQHP